MKKAVHTKGRTFPVLVTKDEDGFYVVQCPILLGCATQGKTLDAALKNIREVIELCLEEKDNRELAKSFNPIEASFHTIEI